jgi:very-short-patch-repair endonuclease
MSDRLLALAFANHGVLSTADSLRPDVDANAMAALVSSGALVRVRRGAYVLGELWAAATPEQRLALTTRAVLRGRQGTGEAASHQSALAVHGLPVHGVPTDIVDLMGAVRRVRRASRVRVHPVDPSLDVVDVEGCSAVTVDVALAQLVLRDGRDPAVIAADAALASARADPDNVLALTRRLAGSRRSEVRAVRWWGDVDPASESVGESRARLLLTDLGFEVRSQVPVADRGGITFARVDFLVGEHVVVEFDGMLKYADADGKQVLAAEKHREDLLRSLGYEVVRLTWADLARPHRVKALVRSALERAARAHARPAS